jgi:hypothetical protein
VAYADDKEAMMEARKAMVLVSIAVTLAARATQPAPSVADAPGFWLGLLHGLIAPFSLIASLFRDVRIYAYPNAGGWYDFGYYLGIAGTLGGGVTITVRTRPSSPTA